MARPDVRDLGTLGMGTDGWGPWWNIYSPCDAVSKSPQVARWMGE